METLSASAVSRRINDRAVKARKLGGEHTTNPRVIVRIQTIGRSEDDIAATRSNIETTLTTAGYQWQRTTAHSYLITGKDPQ